jgi:hypothetical protein
MDFLEWEGYRECVDFLAWQDQKGTYSVPSLARDYLRNLWIPFQRKLREESMHFQKGIKRFPDTSMGGF